jgi:hypothetical protein
MPYPANLIMWHIALDELKYYGHTRSAVIMYIIKCIYGFENLSKAYAIAFMRVYDLKQSLQPN